MGSNLKEMAEALIPLSDLVIGKAQSSWVEYKVESGTCFGFGLFKQDEVAVQRVFLSKGTIFPEHMHSCWEYLIVYKGNLQHCIGNDAKNLGPTNYVTISPGMTHAGKAKEDTWLIAITIPAGKGYPNGSTQI